MKLVSVRPLPYGEDVKPLGGVLSVDAVAQSETKRGSDNRVKTLFLLTWDEDIYSLYKYASVVGSQVLLHPMSVLDACRPGPCFHPTSALALYVHVILHSISLCCFRPEVLREKSSKV